MDTDWPVILTVDGNLEHARSLRRPLTLSEAETAFSRVGRNGEPALLFDLYWSGCLSVELLRSLVVGAWSGAEWPESCLPRAQWVQFFRLAAYPPPSGPLTLYRGATPHHARRMAWTTDIVRAQWFADRFSKYSPEAAAQEAAVAASFGLPYEDVGDPRFRMAYVYTVTAQPEAVLADVDAIRDGGRGEAEIIVDPAMLPKLTRVSRS